MTCYIVFTAFDKISKYWKEPIYLRLSDGLNRKSAEESGHAQWCTPKCPTDLQGALACGGQWQRQVHKCLKCP